MRVKILSGNLTGQIVEQSLDEAEANIATGFAERAPEEVPTARRFAALPGEAAANVLGYPGALPFEEPSAEWLRAHPAATGQPVVVPPATEPAAREPQ